MTEIPLILEEIQLGLFDPALRLTKKGQVYANPLVMGALNGVASATGFLGYSLRGESTVILRWVQKGTRGAVKVRRKDGERTAIWSFGPVLALYPDLKVEKGYVRRFPFRVEEGEFLIDVTVNEVVLSKRK